MDGHIAPGFERVGDAFEENFRERNEIGAACAVMVDGELKVDIWGGQQDKDREWTKDTIVPVFSASKGMASMTLAVAKSRGWLDWDTPVCHYWPEFAQNGKEKITVRELLCHRAGLCVIDEPIDVRDVVNSALVDDIIARQKPVWEPGTQQGYHAISLGWYESALLRRVDPQKRSLQKFFDDEIATPWELHSLDNEPTWYFGFPLDADAKNLAHVHAVSLALMPFHIHKLGWSFVAGFMNPFSISSRSIRNPRGFNDPRAINDREIIALDVPAVTGAGQVRTMAKAYGNLANGGGGVVDENTVVDLAAPSLVASGAPEMDLVVRCETRYSLGFMKPFPKMPFSKNLGAFGTPGAGGSFAFADPSCRLGFAYAPNRMDFYIFDDPRENALRTAVYACLE